MLSKAEEGLPIPEGVIVAQAEEYIEQMQHWGGPLPPCLDCPPVVIYACSECGHSCREFDNYADGSR